jgi:hypothetical protein
MLYPRQLHLDHRTGVTYDPSHEHGSRGDTPASIVGHRNGFAVFVIKDDTFWWISTQPVNQASKRRSEEENYKKSGLATAL